MFWTNCKTCQRVRIFMALSVLLIILIGLQPESALVMAGMVPSATTLSVVGMVLGTLAFWVRYSAWRRETAKA